MPLSYVRYEVLLPVRHNDGRQVEKSNYTACLDEVVDRFGGATLEPQRLSGRWVYQGEEIVDEMLRLVVEVEDLTDHHEWFAAWKETLKRRFEQVEIRMTWHPIHVV